MTTSLWAHPRSDCTTSESHDVKRRRLLARSSLWHLATFSTNHVCSHSGRLEQMIASPFAFPSPHCHATSFLFAYFSLRCQRCRCRSLQLVFAGQIGIGAQTRKFFNIFDILLRIINIYPVIRISAIKLQGCILGQMLITFDVNLQTFFSCFFFFLIGYWHLSFEL